MKPGVLAWLPLLVIGGCSPQSAHNPISKSDAKPARETVSADIQRAPVEAGGNKAIAVPAALNPPAPGTPGGLPDDRTPVAEAPFTPDSAQGAANIVQTYYALLGEGHYRQAFALRRPKEGSAEAFAADFARYSEYHANIGAPGPIDAGAGQRYVTVPVQIYARLKQGLKPLYQIGHVTLHRTADIDGASDEQRQWRIQSIDLTDVPAR